MGVEPEPADNADIPIMEGVDRSRFPTYPALMASRLHHEVCLLCGKNESKNPIRVCPIISDEQYAQVRTPM